MHTKKGLFSVVAVAVIAVVAILAYRYWRASALSFDCSNEVLLEASSPNKRYTATVVERNCGATTPYSRIVILRLAENRLNADKYEDWVFVSKGQLDIRLKWQEPHHLDIVTNANDENMHKSWKDVEITAKLPTP